MILVTHYFNHPCNSKLGLHIQKNLTKSQLTYTSFSYDIIEE